MTERSQAGRDRPLAPPVGADTARDRGLAPAGAADPARDMLAPPPARERADAARNRARILEAAAPLLADAAGSAVTMEQVAAAAGVGKATLYRRYPDVASIAVALLDEHERELQDRLLSGPPPLGPGAAPGERLAAFYAAMVELLERHGHLALAAEHGARRYATGAYGAWSLHVAALLAEAGRDGAPALVDALLAPLAPDVFAHQRASGMSPDAIADALATIARGVLR